ncbi:MAG: HEAT repeat domain-containing protein [Candidatus Omnitrophota bacterium]
MAFVFTVTSVSWTTPAAAAPAEVRAPVVFSIDTFAIPSEMGTITETSFPLKDHRQQTTDQRLESQNTSQQNDGEKSLQSSVSSLQSSAGPDRLVILIQDAHAVIDAQQNIAKILGHLRTNYDVRLTALEGAKGRLEPVLLRTFPEPSVKRKILAGYEKKAELTGPEMAAVLEEKAGEYRGMEDWGLYEKNYFAYLRAQEKKPSLLARWNTFKQTLDGERAKVYAPALNEFEEIRENFLVERASLLDLLIYLSKFKDLLKTTPKYQELPKLLESIGYEGSGKSGALASLVRKIADEFKAKYLRGLGVKTEMNFYNRYQAFMTGQITPGQMLQYLVQLGDESGKAVKLSPALKRMLGHAELLSEIKGSRLGDELQGFLSQVESSLIKTPAEREIAEKYRKLFLLKEMISLELIHEDFASYQKEPDSYLGLIADPEFKRDLASALEFYKVALERDQAFFKNIMLLINKEPSRTPNSGPRTVAVVAGGFHTQGLERLLKEKGVAYAVVAPKIASLAGQENYAKVMKGDVSFKEGLKTTYFDALMRDAARKMVEALPIQDRVMTLKVWRDNVVREFAAQGRIADVGKYLPYIDEVLQKMGSDPLNAAGGLTPLRTKEEILDVVRKELEKFKKDSFERIWKTFEFQLDIFTDGLKQLISRKDLNAQSVSSLLDRASQSKPSFVALIQSLDPNIRVMTPPVLPGMESPAAVTAPPTAVPVVAPVAPTAEMSSPIQRSEVRDEEPVLEVPTKKDPAAFPASAGNLAGMSADTHPAMEMNRRTFLGLTLASIVGGTLMGVFAPARAVLAQTGGSLGPNEFELDRLEGLSRKEAEVYFESLNKRLREKSVSGTEVQVFLQKVFRESHFVWTRAQAVKILIRHGWVNFEEAKALAASVPDEVILRAIYDAIAENPTEAILLYLREIIKTEWNLNYSTMEAFSKALENAKVIPPSIVEEVMTGARDERNFAYQNIPHSIVAPAIGILARKNPAAHDLLLEMCRKITNPNFMYELPSALAKAGTAQAERVLIQWTQEKRGAALLLPIRALGGFVSPTAEARLLTMSYDEKLTPDMKKALIDGLVQQRTAKAVARLIEWSHSESSPEVLGEFARMLGKTKTPEAEIRLMELSRDPRPDVRKLAAYGLADLGSHKAEERLLEWSRDPYETSTVMHFVVQGLRNLGTGSARDRLMEWHDSAKKAGDTDLILYDIIPALAEHPSLDTLAWFSSRVEQESPSIERPSIARTITENFFKMSGYRFFEIASQRLGASSGDSVAKWENVLRSGVYEIDSFILRVLNLEVERDLNRGEAYLAKYASRLRSSPEALYPILALSQEVTSHSFPLLQAAFRNDLIRKYGAADVFRFSRERFGRSFLANYLFVLTIFGKLEGELNGLAYSPAQLADQVFLQENVQAFLKKPALFAKVVTAVSDFKNADFKNAFFRQVEQYLKDSKQLKLLVRLMVDYGLLKGLDPRIADVVRDVVLPPLNPVWRGPQRDWLGPDGSLRVGLYWSTSKDGEAAHYQQFPGIFMDGKKVNSFYMNFSGYEDLSGTGEYPATLKKLGARGVLVKKFPATGRRVEIYLFSDLENIKKSPFPITISRGHAGEKGNTDYPGVVGGMRLVSHCRSIDNVDTLIMANPQNAPMAITGTGQAAETNPVLYYLLEYLGSESAWGSWKDVKDFIRPHMPRSIEKYGFPQDDMSFIYAAALQMIKSEAAPEVGAAQRPMTRSEVRLPDDVSRAKAFGGWIKAVVKGIVANGPFDSSRRIFLKRAAIFAGCAAVSGSIGMAFVAKRVEDQFQYNMKDILGVDGEMAMAYGLYGFNPQRDSELIRKLEKTIREARKKIEEIEESYGLEKNDQKESQLAAVREELLNMVKGLDMSGNTRYEEKELYSIYPIIYQALRIVLSMTESGEEEDAKKVKGQVSGIIDGIMGKNVQLSEAETLLARKYFPDIDIPRLNKWEFYHRCQKIYSPRPEVKEEMEKANNEIENQYVVYRRFREVFYSLGDFERMLEDVRQAKTGKFDGKFRPMMDEIRKLSPEILGSVVKSAKAHGIPKELLVYSLILASAFERKYTLREAMSIAGKRADWLPKWQLSGWAGRQRFPAKIAAFFGMALGLNSTSGPFRMRDAWIRRATGWKNAGNMSDAEVAWRLTDPGYAVEAAAAFWEHMIQFVEDQRRKALNGERLVKPDSIDREGETWGSALKTESAKYLPTVSEMHGFERAFLAALYFHNTEWFVGHGLGVTDGRVEQDVNTQQAFTKFLNPLKVIEAIIQSGVFRSEQLNDPDPFGRDVAKESLSLYQTPQALRPETRIEESVAVAETAGRSEVRMGAKVRALIAAGMLLVSASLVSIDAANAGAMGAATKGSVKIEMMASLPKDVRTFLLKVLDRGAVLEKAEKREAQLDREGKEVTMKRVSADLSRIIDKVYAELPENERKAMHNLAMYIMQIESGFENVVQRTKSGKVIVGLGFGQVEVETFKETLFHYLKYDFKKDHFLNNIHEAEKAFVDRCLRDSVNITLDQLISVSQKADPEMLRLALARLMLDNDISLMMVLIKMDRLRIDLESGRRKSAEGETKFSQFRDSPFNFYKLYRGSKHETPVRRLLLAERDVEELRKPVVSESGRGEEGKSPAEVASSPQVEPAPATEKVVLKAQKKVVVKGKIPQQEAATAPAKVEASDPSTKTGFSVMWLFFVGPLIAGAIVLRTELSTKRRRASAETNFVSRAIRSLSEAIGFSRKGYTGLENQRVSPVKKGDPKRRSEVRDDSGKESAARRSEMRSEEASSVSEIKLDQLGTQFASQTDFINDLKMCPVSELSKLHSIVGDIDKGGALNLVSGKPLVGVIGEAKSLDLRFPPKGSPFLEFWKEWFRERGEHEGKTILEKYALKIYRGAGGDEITFLARKGFDPRNLDSVVHELTQAFRDRYLVVRINRYLEPHQVDYLKNEDQMLAAMNFGHGVNILVDRRRLGGQRVPEFLKHLGWRLGLEGNEYGIVEFETTARGFFSISIGSVSADNALEYLIAMMSEKLGAEAGRSYWIEKRKVRDSQGISQEKEFIRHDRVELFAFWASRLANDALSFAKDTGRNRAVVLPSLAISQNRNTYVKQPVTAEKIEKKFQKILARRNSPKIESWGDQDPLTEVLNETAGRTALTAGRSGMPPEKEIEVIEEVSVPSYGEDEGGRRPRTRAFHRLKSLVGDSGGDQVIKSLGKLTREAFGIKPTESTREAWEQGIIPFREAPDKIWIAFTKEALANRGPPVSTTELDVMALALKDTLAGRGVTYQTPPMIMLTRIENEKLKLLNGETDSPFDSLLNAQDVMSFLEYEWFRDAIKAVNVKKKAELEEIVDVDWGTHSVVVTFNPEKAKMLLKRYRESQEKTALATLKEELNGTFVTYSEMLRSEVQDGSETEEAARRSEMRQMGHDQPNLGIWRQWVRVALVTLCLSGAWNLYDSVTSLAMSATTEQSDSLIVSSGQRPEQVKESLTRKRVSSRMIVEQAKEIEKELGELGPEKIKEVVSEELVRMIRDVRDDLSAKDQDALHNILMHLFMIESEFRSMIQRNSKGKPAFVGGLGFGQVNYRTMANFLLNYLTREVQPGDPDHATLQKELAFVAGCFGFSSSEELMELLPDLKAFYKKPQNKPTLQRNLVYLLMRSGHSSKAFSLFQFVAMVKLLQGVPPNKTLSDFVYDPDKDAKNTNNKDLSTLYASHYIGVPKYTGKALGNLEETYKAISTSWRDSSEDMAIVDENEGEGIIEEEIVAEVASEDVSEPKPAEIVPASSWMTLGGVVLALGLFLVGVRIGVWKSLFGKAAVPPRGKEPRPPEVGSSPDSSTRSEDQRSEMRADGDSLPDVEDGKQLVALFPDAVRTEAKQLIMKREQVMTLIERLLTDDNKAGQAGQVMLEAIKSGLMKKNSASIAKVDELFRVLVAEPRSYFSGDFVTGIVKAGFIETNPVSIAKVNEWVQALMRVRLEEWAGQLVLAATEAGLMEKSAAITWLDKHFYVLIKSARRYSAGELMIAFLRSGLVEKNAASIAKVDEWFYALKEARWVDFAGLLVIAAVKSGLMEESVAITRLNECLQLLKDAQRWDVAGLLLLEAVKSGLMEESKASLAELDQWFQMHITMGRADLAGHLAIEAVKSGVMGRGVASIGKVDEWFKVLMEKGLGKLSGELVVEAVKSGLLEKNVASIAKVDEWFQTLKKNGLEYWAGPLVVEAVRFGLMEKGEASIARVDECFQATLKKNGFESQASELVIAAVSSGLMEKDAASVLMANKWFQTLRENGLEDAAGKLLVAESSGLLSFVKQSMPEGDLEDALQRSRQWVRKYHLTYAIDNRALGEILFGQDKPWLDALDQGRDSLGVVLAERNSELSLNRRLVEGEISRMLSMTVAVEVLVPGAMKNLEGLIRSQKIFSANMLRKWITDKQGVLENPRLAKALLNYQERLKDRSGQKYSPDVTGLLELMNVASIFGAMGRERALEEELQFAGMKALPPTPLAKNLKRQLVLFLAQDLGIEISGNGLPEQVHALLDWNRAHLLVKGLKTIESGEQGAEERGGLMRATLTSFFGGRFMDFIENTDQTDAIGRPLALHNKRVRDLGKQNGDDMDAWLGKNSKVEPRELLYSGQGQDRAWSPDADVDQVLEDAGKTYAAANNASAGWVGILGKAGLKVAEKEGKVEFQVSQEGPKKNDAVKILTNVKLLGADENPGTLLSAVRNMIQKLQGPQDRKALEAATHFYEKLVTLKLRLLDRENQKILAMRTYFQFRLYGRQPGQDLFIGDKVTCCLGMGSGQFPHAMVERLVDEGMSVMEVVDDKTGETMAAAWLYLDEDGSLVIQNLEIHAAYERSQALMFWIGEQTINYAGYVQQKISAKDLYLGIPGHGKYVSNDDFIEQVVIGKLGGRKVPFAKKKLGGTWGEEPYYLDSADKAEAYLIPSRSVTSEVAMGASRSEVRGGGEIVSRGESFDVVFERASKDSLGEPLQDPRIWSISEKDEAQAEKLSKMSLAELGDEIKGLFLFEIPGLGRVVPINDLALLNLTGKQFFQGFVDHLNGELSHYIGYARPSGWYLKSLQSLPDWPAIQLELNSFSLALREVALRWSEKKSAEGRPVPSAKPSPKKAGVRIEIPEGVPAIAEHALVGEVFNANQLGLDAGLLAKRLYELSSRCYIQEGQKVPSVLEWLDILEDPESVFILRDLSGEIVGAAVRGSKFTLKGEEGVWLDRLMSVNDNVQGKGTFLLDVFLSQMSRLGVTIFRWNVSRFSENFYLNEEKGYLKPRQDAGMLERLKHDPSRSVTPEADVEIKLLADPLAPEFDDLRKFVGSKRSEVRYEIPEGVKAIAPDIGVGEVVDARDVLKADPTQLEPLAKFLDAFEVKHFSWEKTEDGVREWKETLGDSLQHVQLLVRAGDVVGVALSISPLPHVGGAQLVQIISVEDGMKGKGTYLLDVFLSEMFKRDLKKIEWHSLSDAKDFYDHFLNARSSKGILQFKLDGDSYKITLLKNPLDPEFDDLRKFVGTKRSEARFEIPEGFRVIVPDIGVGEVLDVKDFHGGDPGQEEIETLAKGLYEMEWELLRSLAQTWQTDIAFWKSKLGDPEQYIYVLRDRSGNLVGAVSGHFRPLEGNTIGLDRLMSFDDGVRGRGTLLLDAFLDRMYGGLETEFEWTASSGSEAFYDKFLADREARGILTFEKDGFKYKVRLFKSPLASEFDDLRDFVGYKRSEMRNFQPLRQNDVDPLGVEREAYLRHVRMGSLPDSLKPLSHSFEWPVDMSVATRHIANFFGTTNWPTTDRDEKHDGIDLQAEPGTSVYPVEDGFVVYVQRFDGRGDSAAASFADVWVYSPASDLLWQYVHLQRDSIPEHILKHTWFDSKSDLGVKKGERLGRVNAWHKKEAVRREYPLSPKVEKQYGRTYDHLHLEVHKVNGELYTGFGVRDLQAIDPLLLLRPLYPLPEFPRMVTTGRRPVRYVEGRSEVRLQLPKGVRVVAKAEGFGEVVNARDWLALAPDQLKPLEKELQDSRKDFFFFVNDHGDISAVAEVDLEGGKKASLGRLASLDDGIRGKGRMVLGAFFSEMFKKGIMGILWRDTSDGNFYESVLKPLQENGILTYTGTAGSVYNVTLLKDPLAPEFAPLYALRRHDTKFDLPSNVPVVAEYPLGKIVDAREWLKLAPDQLKPLASRLYYLDRPSFVLGKWEMDTGFWEAMLEDPDQAMWVFVDKNGEISGAAVPRGPVLKGKKEMWLDSLLSLDNGTLAPFMELFLNLMSKEGVERIGWYSSDDRELDILNARQEKGLLTFKHEGRSYEVNLLKNPLGESGGTQRSEARFEIPKEAVIAEYPGLGKTVDAKRFDPSKFEQLARRIREVETESYISKMDVEEFERSVRELEASLRDPSHYVYVLFDPSEDIAGVVRGYLEGETVRLARLMSSPDKVRGRGSFLLDTFLSEMSKKQKMLISWNFTGLSEGFYTDEEKGFLNPRQEMEVLKIISSARKGLEDPRPDIEIKLLANPLDSKFVGLRKFWGAQRSEAGLGPVAVGIPQSPATSTPERAEARSEAIISEHEILGTVVNARKSLEENPDQLKSLAARLFNLELSRGFSDDSNAEGRSRWEKTLQDQNTLVYVLMKPKPLGAIGGVVVANIALAKVTLLISARDKIRGNGTITFDAALSDMFMKDMKQISLSFPADARRFYVEFLEPRVEAGMLTVKPSIHELKNNPNIHKFAIDILDDPLDPKFEHLRDFFGSRRSEVRIDQNPLEVLTGTPAVQITQMTQDSNPDAVQALLLRQGQAGIDSEKTKFGDQETALMAQLQGYKDVAALTEFVSTGLTQLLVKLFEPYGMTDAIAAEISMKALIGGAEASPALMKSGDVRRSEVRKIDIKKTQGFTSFIDDLISKMPGSGVSMIVEQGPDSNLELDALRKMEKIPRLVVLYDKNNPVGRGWDDVSNVVMKIRISERKPANVLVRDVVKASESEPFMAFFTRELGVEPHGILSILADFKSKDNPELKKLVCAAVALINRIYAAASPMDQELMKVDPSMLISKLKEKGIDLLALSAKNGVLTMDMEMLTQEFAASRAVEKAA